MKTHFKVKRMISDKIKSREELKKICDRLKRNGKTIGFTSGAFDLIHAGHVDYLEKAKQICDTLVVGVNSNRSIQKYKGLDRPVLGEDQRVKVIAALESVDYVFLFNERRNQKNIEALKPNYYIKAGDYKLEGLTSKEVVKQYGGEIRLIPIKEEISSTHIIDKIVYSTSHRSGRFVEEGGAVHINRRPSKKSQAVFLDRDGTINEDVGYLHKPERFKFLINALEGLKKIQEMGYRIIIVTNQPGIGLGYFPEEDFYEVNRVMLKAFSKAGIMVDKIYFCPHSKAEKCSCRKPNQALIERSKEELNLDISRSFMVGDKTSDMEMGKRAGMRTILVETGFKGEDGEYSGEPDYWAKDILDAAHFILKNERL